MWQAGEISFDLDESAAEHPTVTVVCLTPAGELRVLADIVRTGRVIAVAGAHIQGLDANQLGVGGLIALGRVAKAGALGRRRPLPPSTVDTHPRQQGP